MRRVFQKIEVWLFFRKGQEGVFSPILYIFSQVYRWVVLFRNLLFDWGCVAIYRARKNVVSVGNIAVGGTGKTSFVYLLAKEVFAPVAILERGYRAKKVRRSPFLVTLPEEGDEAFLLAKKLPFAKVIVGKNRKKSARLAEKLSVGYILLDDGMQYRSLYRDIEIVLLHYEDLKKKGYFLPRGWLREDPKRLEKADYVVIQGDAEETLGLQMQSKIKAPMMGVSYKMLNGEVLRDQTVGAFCGIGRPGQFYTFLNSLGCHIVEKKELPDHAALDEAESFFSSCLEKGAKRIVCTEKDFVKLQQPLKEKYPLVPLLVELSVVWGKAHFDELVERVRNYGKER